VIAIEGQSYRAREAELAAKSRRSARKKKNDKDDKPTPD